MKRDSAKREPTVKARKPRGRPRSFDREGALDAAMQVFWQKGYESTSISDLTEAMGINPPSLYAAFGDKESLFLEAIQRYAQTRNSACSYCEQPTAREAVETLLTFLATQLCDSCQPRGCMMMMAITTASNSSPQLQKALADMRSGSRDRMKDRIKRGIADGDVAAGTDAGALADFYSTIMTGMSMNARDGASRKSLMATVAQAMQVFPVPPRRAGTSRPRRSSAR